MERIAIFGKGGIGKSTIAVGLSSAYALEGRKVLHVGCDPKHDSTMGLLQGELIETFMDKMIRSSGGRGQRKFAARELYTRGILGVDCVEAGGPEAGVGCAGRGISLMLETFEETRLLEDGRYDVCLFDVLGDVVCGGFAAPLRKGFAEKILIVVSEELMSLYAANNIAKAVRNYASNGVRLAGLAANIRTRGAATARLEVFARALNTRILEFFPRDAAVVEAEFAGSGTVVQNRPDCGFSRGAKSLARKLLEIAAKDCPLPTPLDDERFYRLWRN
jgi:nitrogenase iron protein NifH